MSESNIDIIVEATDNASGTIQQVASNTESSLNEISDASNTVTEATDQTTASSQQVGLAFNNVATSGFALVMSVENIEKSQVMLDRANLVVERSTETLQTAQENYNAVVEKYGANSQQAQDALAKLAIAEDAHNVALERQNVAQLNVNNSMVMAAVTVIPSIITMVSSVITITQGWTGAQAALNLVLEANPILLVVAAVAALVVGLVIAYEKVGWLRDAVNACGSAILGFANAILNAVSRFNDWVSGEDAARAATNALIISAGNAGTATNAVSESVNNFGASARNAAADNVQFISSVDKANLGVYAYQSTMDTLRTSLTNVISSTDSYVKKLEELEVQKASVNSTSESELNSLNAQMAALRASTTGVVEDTSAYKTLQGQIASVTSTRDVLLGSYDAEISKIQAIPGVIKSELVDKAQSAVQTYKDCVSGKMADLSDKGQTATADLVSTTNDLIKNGLVGQAQDNIQAFVDCAGGKSQKMVDSMTNDIQTLTATYDTNTAKIADLVKAGALDEAAVLEASNEDIKAKITQLETWRNDYLASSWAQSTDIVKENLTEIMDAIAAANITPTATPFSPDVVSLPASGAPSAITLAAMRGRLPGLAEGGIVTSPTLRLVGEAGPEAIIPLGQGGGLGLGNISVTVNVEGSADQRTVDFAVQRIRQELKNVIVEASSSQTAATHKRIRNGAVF